MKKGIYCPHLNEYATHTPYGTKLPIQLKNDPWLLDNYADIIAQLLRQPSFVSQSVQDKLLQTSEPGYEMLYRIVKTFHPALNSKVGKDPPLMSESTDATEHARAIHQYLRIVHLKNPKDYLNALRIALSTFTDPYLEVANQVLHSPATAMLEEHLPPHLQHIQIGKHIGKLVESIDSSQTITNDDSINPAVNSVKAITEPMTATQATPTPMQARAQLIGMILIEEAMKVAKSPMSNDFTNVSLKTTDLNKGSTFNKDERPLQQALVNMANQEDLKHYLTQATISKESQALINMAIQGDLQKCMEQATQQQVQKAQNTTIGQWEEVETCIQAADAPIMETNTTIRKP